MKIESGRGVTPSQAGKRAGATAAPGFAPATDAPQRTQAPASLGPVGALDAILALQAEGFDPGRRSRQVRRAEAALDALARLERGLVEGRADGAVKADLLAAQAASAPTGEPGLDAILLEVDTRVAVELAKLERLG
jgi:hypothetical protein